MDEIARTFMASATPGPEPTTPEVVSPSDLSGTLRPETGSAETSGVTFNPLRLSPDQIAPPAFFVDSSLSLCWTAPDGTNAFSRSLAEALESASTRNVFTLLLAPSVKKSLPDWEALFSFIYTMLRRSTSRDTFDSATGFISKDNIPATDTDRPLLPAVQPFHVDSRIIGDHDDSSGPPLRIFGLEFKEGTLFLFRPDRWHAADTGGREKKSSVDEIVPSDEKKTICVLTARLNDSHRIADTMLPEFFFQLMNRIWKKSEGVVRSLGGIRAACNGAEIQYMFTENAGRNPIFSAICCATRLHVQMQALEENFKAEQGWTDELRMNIGISSGTNDLTAPEPAGCMEFTIPGGAADQSSHLSTVAGKGEIWITKDAVAQLPKKLTDQVVLGIDRQGRFCRNFFIRLSDLPGGTGSSRPKPDLGTLSIARIVGIETKKPDQPETKEV